MQLPGSRYTLAWFYIISNWTAHTYGLCARGAANGTHWANWIESVVVCLPMCAAHDLLNISFTYLKKRKKHTNSDQWRGNQAATTIHFSFRSEIKREKRIFVSNSIEFNLKFHAISSKATVHSVHTHSLSLCAQVIDCWHSAFTTISTRAQPNEVNLGVFVDKYSKIANKYVNFHLWIS